ncbi:MAG: orotate phosphoribosyltransferase [Gammaproteobacteria bacterium]|nr:MAG: orotate phosphoribosyltransferase [Gammaproteobacteria bacterium]PIE37444.1 MAG: orotate phosphoribosyltransferase [Gammaproteobacteria bacterium]
MFRTSFASQEEIARETSRMLLEIAAVHFRPSEPYRLTSGLASPVYIDCRKLISFPRIRSTLMDFATTSLVRGAGYEAFDAVAGGETAGIPFSAWIAERLDLPMQYVRKKPKGFGRGARIEGEIEEGQRVLLVEDLSTDGGSKIGFVEALRDAGAVVEHTWVVFNYGVFEKSEQALRDAGITLHYLATWHDVLAESRRAGHFDDSVHAGVEAFLADPIGWSEAHGGEYQPKL